MNKQDYAIELKHNRHNCAQAVLCAYADELEMPAETLKNLGSAFGGGMGNMKGNCGALCGAVAVLGLMKGGEAPLGRAASALHDSFVKQSGSAICKEIKGVETGTILCSCDDCVRNAVNALEEILHQN